MMRIKAGGVWVAMVVVVLGLMLTCVRCDRRIRVGGNAGWAPNSINYTDWAAKQHFYVRDWLLFVYDKHYYNVLEVNKTNYEACNEGDYITNITRGGRDVFLLNQTRPYYFISSGGYCWNNMKMALNVEPLPDAPPPSHQTNNGSPILSLNRNYVIVLALSLFALILCI